MAKRQLIWLITIFIIIFSGLVLFTEIKKMRDAREWEYEIDKSKVDQVNKDAREFLDSLDPKGKEARLMEDIREELKKRK